MTAEIVNLRRARKTKARAEDADQAARNRAKHGQTLAEREGRAMETARATRLLDQHRLAPDDGA